MSPCTDQLHSWLRSGQLSKTLLISHMAAGVPFGWRQLRERDGLTFGQEPFSLITFIASDSCHSSHTVPQSSHEVLTFALLIGFLVSIRDIHITIFKNLFKSGPLPQPTGLMNKSRNSTLARVRHLKQSHIHVLPSDS